MEDVEKDVIPLISKILFYLPRDIEEKSTNHYQNLKKIDTPSKKVIDELLKIYPDYLINFDYLKQYWLF